MKIFFILFLVLPYYTFAQQPTFNWVKGIESDDTGLIEDIDIDASGNLYVTGGYSGTVDFDPGIGVANLTNVNGTSFIAKYDANGNYIWAVDFEYQSSAAYIYSYGIATTTNGEIYVVGEYNTDMDLNPGVGVSNVIPVGDDDIFIVKLDSNGNFIWGHSIGGIYSEFASEVATDQTGAVYIVGSFLDSIDVDPSTGTNVLVSNGLSDALIVKYDANGNFVWGHSQGGWSSDLAQDVVVDAANNVYIAGRFRDSADADPSSNVHLLTTTNLRNIFIQKHDPNGNLIWAGSLASNFIVDFYDLDIDNQNNIYLTGSYYEATDMDIGSGTSYVYTTSTNEDAYAVKYDSSGTIQWVNTLSDSTNFPQRGTNVSVDNLGNVFTTGIFMGTVDFDPGVTVTAFTSETTASNLYIQKLDSLGNFEWAGAIEDKANTASILGLDIGINNQIYAVGGIVDSTDFDPNAGIQLLYPSPFTSFPFVLCLNGDLSVNVNNQLSSLKNIVRIYPNPTNNFIQIVSQEAIKELTIVDFTGKLVKTLTMNNPFNYRVNIENLPSGFYFLTCTSNTTTYTYKIIKE